MWIASKVGLSVTCRSHAPACRAAPVAHPAAVGGRSKQLSNSDFINDNIVLFYFMGVLLVIPAHAAPM